IDGLGCETAALEITGARTAREILLKEGAGRFHDRAEARLPFGALAFLRGVLRHFEPGLAGETIDGIAEIEPVGLHDEGDRIAMGATAEAMVMRLVIVIDVEARALLVVERAKPRRLLAPAVETHLLAHQVEDRQATAQLIQECRRKRQR